MRPLGDNILVSPIVQTNQIAGLELSAGAGRELPQKGVVTAVGPDVKTAQKDDQVIFSKHAGVKITVDNKDILILRERELFAIL